MEISRPSKTDDKRLAGLFAAVVTPIDDRGQLDLDTFDRLVDALVDSGASGICIAGATGEYPHFESADRKRVIRRAAARLPRDRALLVGIGGSSMHHTNRARAGGNGRGQQGPLVADADVLPVRAAGPRGVLQPCERNAASAVPPVQPPRVHQRPHRRYHRKPAPERGVRGWSKGQQWRCRQPRRTRESARGRTVVASGRGRLSPAERIGRRLGWRHFGRCRILPGARRRGVSELRSGASGRGRAASGSTRRADRAYRALSDALGIKIGLAARGIDTGPLPLPLTATRRQQVTAFAEWFQGWLPRTGLAAIASSPSGSGLAL